MMLIPRALLCACAVAIGSASCGLLSPQPDASRFAILASVDELPGSAPNSSAPSPALTLGLGPISMPDYLKSAAIVTREGGTRLRPSPTERWAEPFDRALERVLTIDLRRTTGAGSVAPYPWYATDRPQVQIEIAFSRCERDESAHVIVAAHWQLRWLDGSREPKERDTRLEQPCPSGDGAEVALAISRALAELCGQIGTELR